MLAMVLPFTPPVVASPGPASWALLVVRAQAGDKLAYAQFLREVLPWVQHVARRMVSVDMIDDVVQESLMAIHRVLHTFDANRPLNPWLYGIVRFKAKESWRRAQRHVHDALDDAMCDAQGDTSAVVDVDALLGKLPAAHANVIRLTKLQGLSMEEAAQATGQSVSWVKVTVHRALKKLGMVAKADE